jgi:hypothetical protein
MDDLRTVSEMAGQAPATLTLSELAGEPPTLTLSELASLGHLVDHRFDVVIKRGQRYRNVFQRMRDALRRIVLVGYRLKWALSPLWSKRLDNSHDVRS